MKMIPFVMADGEAAVAASVATEVQAVDTAATTTEGTATAPGGKDNGGGLGMFVPMLIIFGLFYFMMIRPQQRKEKERRKMIDELRAGAKVLLSSGFIGTIVEANDKTFKVEIADGVVVEVVRSAVQSLASEPAAK